jgi:hypothetical protein
VVAFDDGVILLNSYILPKTVRNSVQCIVFICISQVSYSTCRTSIPVIHSKISASIHLSGLVVRVLGYRSGGLGSIPGTTRKKKVACLEQGALSLVSTTEELLDRKVAAPVYKT